MLTDVVLVAAVVGACIYVARGTRRMAAIECAVPLLAIVALWGTNKFFWFGLIVAAAFAAAALVARELWVLAIAGVLLLRWIPLRDVEVWRELVILGGAMALFFAIKGAPASAPAGPPPSRRRDAAVPAGGTPVLLTLIATLAVAAATPSHPGKATLIPLLLAAICVGAPALGRAVGGIALLGLAMFARWSLVPLLVAAAFALLVPFLDKLKPLAYAAALALFALWPWSGIVARALPVVTRYEAPIGERRMVGLALARGQSATVPVPAATHAVVNASVANGAGLADGRVVGWVNDRAIRIGDVADFGFTRRQHFFAARNPLPRVTRADVRGYGATAWLHGAGAVGVASGAPMTALHFRAADDLPSETRLQIEWVELPAR